MSLTRKFLASKGLEADVIEEIIAAHTETVNGLKDKIDEANKYKETAEKVPDLEKQIETLKKSATAEDYESLKTEYEKYKKDVQAKSERKAKEDAYKEILKDAGIPEKHFAKICKYSDIDGLELDDDGKIKTAKDLLASIKEEWGDHIEKTGKKGAETATPPKGGAGSTKTKEEIMAIEDDDERQQAIAENHELFGI